MSNSFDPYHRWLGIPRKHQPADHYRLLGVERFEDDVEVIRDAADRQMRHVRTYELGPHGKLTQKILTELAQAKLCLLDARKRAAYDETLRDDTTTTTDRQNDAIAAPRPAKPLARADVDPNWASPVPVPTTAQTAPAPTPSRQERHRPLPEHIWYYVGGGMAAVLGLVVVGFVLSGPGEEVPLDGKESVANKTDRPQVEPPVEPPIEPPRSPVFADIGPQTVDEGDRLEVVLQLQDVGTGDGPLRYRLVGGYPSGVSLDDETGTLQWTPTEEEGPGDYAVGVQVSRDAAFRLGDTKTVSIQVGEVNRPPQLSVLPQQTVAVGEEVQFVVQATDPDVPANRLRYELVSGPAGAVLDPTSGRFRWPPGRTAAVSDIVARVRVTDNGTPAASAEREVHIRVEAPRVPPLAVAPFDARQAQAHQEAWSKHLGQPLELINSIGMKFRLIPPGEFQMGSPEGEKDRESDETKHRVQITHPYHLATTEVTQSQYKRVMRKTPWKGKEYVKEGGDYTATYVSWDDAVEFCRRLGDLAAERGKRTTYRLPTEAEWEYACRAGTATVYSFGDSVTKLKDHAWFYRNAYNADERYAHEVGKKRPNGFGLHDMHGNVWEWCSDRYDSGYYTVSPLSNPQGPEGGSLRMYRGGSWNHNAWYCRSAFRRKLTSDYQLSDLGFRVVQVRPE